VNIGDFVKSDLKMARDSIEESIFLKRVRFFLEESAGRDRLDATNAP
jgi:hypothetical protein